MIGFILNQIRLSKEFGLILNITLKVNSRFCNRFFVARKPNSSIRLNKYKNDATTSYQKIVFYINTFQVYLCLIFLFLESVIEATNATKLFLDAGFSILLKARISGRISLSTSTSFFFNFSSVSKS